MTLSWATGTHQGRSRSDNQDSMFPEHDGLTNEELMLVVADGMGGHVAGALASQTALTAAVSDLDLPPGAKVAAGNGAIMQIVQERPEVRGMGTTMTLVEIAADGTASFAHVGDSRAYLLRGGHILQLTVDHTLVAELVATGKITPEQALVHPKRSVVTRALGVGAEMLVDTFEEQLEDDDRLLLCSDGLSVMISDADILAYGQQGSPTESVWALVEAANAAGGIDNITVAIAHFES
jgi:serine/threonine protein phosphatase PrpC